MTANRRWLLLPLAGAAFLVGVAFVAFSLGQASVGGPARVAQRGAIAGRNAPATAQGVVASKTSTTIVVTTAAGKAVTVDVSSSTKYVVRGVTTATLANVAVGDRIAAQGSLNADGSLAATVVQSAPNGQPGFGGFGGHGNGGNGNGGFGHGRGSGGNGRPNPVPSPTASGSSV